MKDGNVHILLAEDDSNLAFVVKDNLEIHGYEVCHCVNGIEALLKFKQGSFDLCLFDVMMPLSDGFTLANKVRELNTDIPIIFLTAKGLKDDKINGFKVGADDYIVKPFNIEELLFRIRVFLKRSGSNKEENLNNIIKLGSYDFNYSNLELLHGCTIKKLTQKEADLLRLLCMNIGKMIKREELLKQVWGTDDYFAGRSMDVFISRLRKYLDADSGIEIINFHGIGFKLSVRV